MWDEILENLSVTIEIFVGKYCLENLDNVSYQLGNYYYWGTWLWFEECYWQMRKQWFETLILSKNRTEKNDDNNKIIF